MGCQWSGDKADFHSLQDGGRIDPVEEHLHLKVWRDPATRQRVILSGPSAENHDVLAIQESLAYHIHLMKESDEENKASQGETLSAAVQRRQEQSSQQQEQAGPSLLIHQQALASTSSTQDARLKRIAELEAQQERARLQELASLDVGCWQEMAEQGLFQKGEDMFSGAAELEEKTSGRTERYAMLMHSIASLYDFRSNVDVTGQQQDLSMTAVKFTERAIQALRILIALEGQDATKDRLKEHLAKTLLMRGKSLCNTCIDGDTRDPSVAVKAFDDAERDVTEAVVIREELTHNQLAEAVMAVGYVHYCRACAVLNSPDPESVVGKIDYMEENFAKAIEHYKKSLKYYIDQLGEEHTDSIRMMCNIALVHNLRSRMPCEQRLECLQYAEKQYQQVLKIQSKVFGKRHQRTSRIVAELEQIAKRKEILIEGKADDVRLHAGMSAAQLEQAEKQRKEQADKLMQEFLEARRAERARSNVRQGKQV